MTILLEEGAMFIIIGMLRLIDGVMVVFDALTGALDVSIAGLSGNITSEAISSSAVNGIFWAIFVLGVGLAGIAGIIGIIKGMLSGDKKVSAVIGRVILSAVISIALMTVSLFAVLLSGKICGLLGNIFGFEGPEISRAVFSACTKDWLNGFSASDLDISEVGVREIMGSYDRVVLWIYPDGWAKNGMIDPDTFMYFPAIITSLCVGIGLIWAGISLTKRVFEITVLYVSIPLISATMPADGGARLKSWIMIFISKLALAASGIISVMVFIAISPVIMSIRIPSVPVAGEALKLFLIGGGALAIPSGMAILTKLVGSGEPPVNAFALRRFFGGAFKTVTKTISNVERNTFNSSGNAFRGSINNNNSLNKKENAKEGNDSEINSQKYTR